VTADRPTLIRARLEQALAPIRLDIEDESHLHAGHAGSREGKGHFNLHIVSDRFAGQTAIARHRMVYAALGELMQTEIHALSIDAQAPEEATPATHG
jgi:BolA protein